MKDHVVESIAHHLANEGVTVEIMAETTLEELDIDSLGLYSMLAGVEDEFGICVSSGEFSQIESVGELADVVITKMNRKAKLQVA